MSQAPQHFRAIVATEDEGVFIELPFDVKAVYGKARPPVVVTVNGYAFRSTPAVYGGRWFIPLRASNRVAAGVTAGDEVDVTIALDTEPRDVEPPADLASELARDDWARAAWDKLSYSRQKELVVSLTEAKTEQTRARRLQKALETLRA